MKKIVMGAVFVLLFAQTWHLQAMDQALDGRTLEQQGDEEKGAPEIELVISGDVVPGSTAPGGENLSSGVQPDIARDKNLSQNNVWGSVWASLLPEHRKELEQHHTSQQLETVFATLPEDARNSADFIENFQLALIKHDKARFADFAAKNRRDYSHELRCVKSFCHTYSLGVIGIVIILCGPLRLQCGK